jgi:hypothetical protein
LVRPVALAEEADAVQQSSGGHAAGSEDDLLPGREIFGAIDPFRIANAHARDAVRQLRPVHHQAGHHFPMQAAQRRGG